LRQQKYHYAARHNITLCEAQNITFNLRLKNINFSFIVRLGVVCYNYISKGDDLMDNTNIVLADNIQKFRKRIGMTQEELAKELGVTFQAVSKWENAKTAPDILFLPTMADLFGCSIDDLFSYVSRNNRQEINIIPDMQVPDEMKDFVEKQIRSQIGKDGSADKFLSIVAENIDGKFKLTDDNIERLLDAYRDLYKGMRKK